MGKNTPYRKPRPSVPKWYWWETDNCWDCDNRKGCNGCKKLKKFIAAYNKNEPREMKQKLRRLLINEDFDNDP